MTDPDLRHSPEPPPRGPIYAALSIVALFLFWLAWLITYVVVEVLG